MTGVPLEIRHLPSLNGIKAASTGKITMNSHNLFCYFISPDETHFVRVRGETEVIS